MDYAKICIHMIKEALDVHKLFDFYNMEQIAEITDHSIDFCYFLLAISYAVIKSVEEGLSPFNFDPDQVEMELIKLNKTYLITKYKLH